ncbi:Protein of unknown function [Pyronema omphalodes CBS 100304]|uniref:Uncharacterized protein n=1 Tax=Pyronema omphalodes (strain CBS 100304) TaxID=1076935 RepID=U4LPJ6_PYROM|nr:Protein of unknown function [Pyronema omphalodes CBS 100304]
MILDALAFLSRHPLFHSSLELVFTTDQMATTYHAPPLPGRKTPDVFPTSEFFGGAVLDTPCGQEPGCYEHEDIFTPSGSLCSALPLAIGRVKIAV